MSFTNFEVSIYCPVHNMIAIKDLDAFAKDMDWLERHVNVTKMYLETYRQATTIEEEQLLKVKHFLQARGIKVAGGITTDDASHTGDGIISLCYNDPDTRAMLKRIVELTARHFDEIILDDFFFTNCKCEKCIAAKGAQSWPEYRLALMKEVSENLIVGPAKAVNPGIKMVIKYPNWYEYYQDNGYNLEAQPKIFDGIHTGNETRDPAHTQQHLPKYLSYFIQRYLENVAPGRNGGGWYDPFGCTYNITSYVDQAALTLLAGAKELTVFCLGAVLPEPFRPLAVAAGEKYRMMDRWLGKLGRPTGTPCYLPYHSKGEDYLHNYLGMIGIPLEPYPEYPADAKRVLLTESAAKDPQILEKIKQSLLNGADVIVTSGFLGQTQGRGIEEFINVKLTQRSVYTESFGVSDDGGMGYVQFEQGGRKILIPQVDYSTNDTWVLAGAFGTDNNFPLLLRTPYGKGRMHVLVVPEDYGDLYHLPKEVLDVIRAAVTGKDSPVRLESAHAGVSLFTYDNGTFAVHAFSGDATSVRAVIKEKQITDLQTGVTTAARPKPRTEGFPFSVKEDPSGEKEYAVTLFAQCGVTRVFKIG